MLLSMWGAVLGVRVILGALRRSRREGIDFGEALSRTSSELQAEVDEEAARAQRRRDLMKDMPPPP